MEPTPPPQFPDEPPLGPPLSPVPPGAIRPPVWVEDPGTPGGPPGRKKVAVALGAAAVIVLLAGFLVLRGGDDGDRSPVALDDPTTTTEAEPEAATTTTEPAETTTTAPPTEAEFDAVVQDIVAFVEQERGLPFLRPPVVRLAASEEFEAALLEDFDEDSADLVTAGQVLEAVGLLEPGTDVVSTFRDLLGAGVVGFYDPETEELLVRGTSTSPYVRTVIAHELTHALDDQRFDLDRPQLDETDDEQSTGFTALVEGNASHVEDAYRATFTPEEEDEASATELELGTDPRIFQIPIPLIEAIQTPYELGPALIEAILDDGGQARLDAAFGTPPTTSEQLLDPSTFIAGQGALPVAAPTPDGEEVDRGVLGELGIAQILGLGPLLNPGPIDDAVAGWGGDQYVAWIGADGLPCLRATIVGDSPEDTAELRDALVDWTDEPPLFAHPVEATVDGGADGAPITLTSCSAG